MTTNKMSSSKIPFEGMPSLNVFQAVVDGQRPEHPGEIAISRGLDDSLWLFVQRCWRNNRDERPTISDLVELVGASDIRPNVSSDQNATPAFTSGPAPFHATEGDKFAPVSVGLPVEEAHRSITLSHDSPPSIGPSMPPNNAAESLAVMLTEIQSQVGERQHRFERLIARCKNIGEQLSVWSVMWSTPGLRMAGTAVQTMITTVQHECEDWSRRWIVQRIARDDYIQADLMAWEQALRECMEDYNRSLLDEILLSDRKDMVRILTQEAATLSLRSMSETTADPEIRTQLQDLIDTGLEARSFYDCMYFY